MPLPRLAAGLVLVAALLATPLARAAEGHMHDRGAQAPAAKAQAPIQIVVSDDGVQPATVSAKAGQPLKLVFTRKTDNTCVTQVVSKDLGINQALPLNQPVTVQVTPSKPGSYRIWCGMGMAIVVVQVQ